jgi:hypothetical protein
MGGKYVLKLKRTVAKAISTSSTGQPAATFEFVLTDEVISLTVVPPDRSQPVEPEEI